MATPNATPLGNLGVNHTTASMADAAAACIATPGCPWSQHWHSYLAALDFTRRVDLWITVLPIIMYWVLSAVYHLLDGAAWAKSYKVWPEPPAQNKVSKSHVVKWVLVQHVVMVLVNLALVAVDPNMCLKPPQPLLLKALRFLLGMLLYDGWQYSIHRLMHEVPYLYRKFHSIHHQLLDVYAFGALYNHPVEAFLLDTVGAVVVMFATGQSCDVSVGLFTFATCKTVFDHSGFRWPLNPVFPLFANNSAYHDVHHNLRGLKLNYSQPFFTLWDRLLGTYAHPDQFRRELEEAQAKKQ